MPSIINFSRIQKIALGASFLSSGGGGSCARELSYLQALMRQNKSINLLTLNDLRADDLILPVAFVGPIIGKEDLLNPSVFKALLSAFTKHYGKQPAALMPGEIGGANGIIPLIMSAVTRIPVLDGDLVGRAFPEVSMAAPNVIGHVSCSPTFLIGHSGESQTLMIPSMKWNWLHAPLQEDGAAAP